MPVYQQSDGSSINKKVLDRNIERAKAKYSIIFLNEYGYIFCERCGKNKMGCPGISRSHIISVKECQNMGKSELTYDKDNFEHLGQKCHLEIETWPNEKRLQWYYDRSDGMSFDDFIKQYNETNNGD